MQTLVVLLVAALVPVFRADITEQRCELRDQLRAAVSPKKVRERRLATVICEVEKFVKESVMRPASPGTSGSQDSRVERRGQGGVDAYLRHCVAGVKGTDITINSACFRKKWQLKKVYLNAGEECKKMDSSNFFQSCSHSKRSKRSVYKKVYEDLDTEEQLEEQYVSDEDSEEPSESEESLEEQSESEEPLEKQSESEEPLEEQSESEEPLEEQFESEEPFEEQSESEERFKDRLNFKPKHKSHSRG